MRDALDYLNHEYGWKISYEDPVYPDAELSDIDIPEWKKAHPGERGFYVPKFSEMQFRIAKPTGSKGEEMKVLTGLVEQFNRSDRSVKYKVLDVLGGRQEVVGTVNGSGAMDRAVLPPEPKAETEAWNYLCWHRTAAHKCHYQWSWGPSPQTCCNISLFHPDDRLFLAGMRFSL